MARLVSDLLHRQLDDIIEIVAAAYSTTPRELRSPARPEWLCQARRVSMFVCRRTTMAALDQIAAAHHRQDHTTVITAIRRCQDDLELDPQGWSGPHGQTVLMLLAKAKVQCDYLRAEFANFQFPVTKPRRKARKTKVKTHA